MSETDLSISHPQISSLYNLYLLETQPFRKVHRMIDLFETIIKMHTMVIMGEYFKRNELSEMAKGMLAYGLQTPSLGTWQKFSRDLCSELVSNNHLFVLNYFKDEFLLFDKANNDKTNIISFRNRYAHGATPTDNDCEADIIQFEPFLLKLLASKWLHESQLIIVDNLVFIQSKTSLEKLNLHPILVCKEETNGQPFTFFNDIKDEKVGLLNYPLSKHYREKKTYIEEFYAVLPLKEWKQNVSNEFKQYIEELTEGFKGRIMELKAISTFITTKEKGYLSIQGNPGIGKSALIAKVSRELNKSEYNKRYKLCEYFIRRGTRSDNNINLLNHLLKTTDIYYPEGKSIMPEGDSNWDLQKALFAKWNAFGNGGPKFKLIFLIDGLDEGVENDILNYLPRENFKNILFIYGSRHGGHLKLASFWTELPIENHETILLGGLNKEDIRAFLYEVVNKYEIDQTWIDEILNRSEGNPLYLKLLCNALENGSIEINNSKALPKEIDSYYKAILDRYAQQTDGDTLFECLLLFAVAEDYLTPAHLGIMNSMSIASQQRVMNILTEVLYENPQTDFVLDYQLFHESFREYLIKIYPLEIKKANQKIIDSCQKWQELETLFEQRYVLEHYATHLVKSATVENKEILVELSKNAAFQKTQNQVLRNYNANYSLLRAALLAASELNQKEDVIEIGLCLVDLQYEEKNDVQSIIDMVANNEMELALLRIENFGGNDKEGLQQKFILYMLCLMELTLLESKHKPFRKEAIEKLLKHLDENLPVDHSVLNWNDFFSSYLIFLMACECATLGLNPIVIYKQTNYLDCDWILENGPYNDSQFNLLLGCVRGKNEEISALVEISTEMAKQGKVDEAASVLQAALTHVMNVNDVCSMWGIAKLREIYIELIRQGHAEAAIACAMGLNDKFDKSGALTDISTELTKQGKLEEATSAMQEALVCVLGISDDYSKDIALRDISIEFGKQGMVEEARKYIQGISDESDKSHALKIISSELTKQGKVEEALICVRDIFNEPEKNRALVDISEKLAEQGMVYEAITHTLDISLESEKNSVLVVISAELAKQGKVEEALTCARGISHDFYMSRALSGISTELAKQGKIDEALTCARGISDYYWKSSALSVIAAELTKQGKVEGAASAMQEALTCAWGISNETNKNDALSDIATKLAKQGNLMQALNLVRAYIIDDNIKIDTLLSIAFEIDKLGETKETFELMQEAYYLARKFEEEDSYSVLHDIAKAFAIYGNIQKYLFINEQIISKCDDHYFINYLVLEIQKTLLSTGNRDLIQSALMQIIKKVKIHNNSRSIDKYLLNISLTYIKQDKIERGFDLLNEIRDNFKNEALNEISKFLIEKGKLIINRNWDEKFIEEDTGEIVYFQNVDYIRKDNINQFFTVKKKVEFKSEEEFDIFTKCKNKEIDFELFVEKFDTINDVHEKITSIVFISDKLFNAGIFEIANFSIFHALNIIKSTPNLEAGFWLYDGPFISLSESLIKQGQFKEVFEIINLIGNDRGEKDRILSLVSIQAAANNLDVLALKTIMKIKSKSIAFDTWSELGKLYYTMKGIFFCKKHITILPNETAVYYYLNGMVAAIKPSDANESNVLELLELVKEDTKSIAHLLQMHALYLCFFENTNPIKMQRLNKTLNIQWAIDIAAKFEKEFERASHNLQEWINEIEDENDREDVLGWAEKVKQGKMTEEKFIERVNKL